MTVPVTCGVPQGSVIGTQPAPDYDITIIVTHALQH